MKHFLCGLIAITLVAMPCDAAPKKKKSSSSSSSSSSSNSNTPDTTPNLSPIQATARPYGFQPIAPVMLNGSDDRAAQFNVDALGEYYNWLLGMITEGARFDQVNELRLDSEKLFMTHDTEYPVRVYFLHEGAGYHNSLGFATALAGADELGAGHLIFPDASFGSSRTSSTPLASGDFVDIGHMQAGTQLDFFLVADGARNSNAHIYTNHDENNHDNLQHMFAIVLPSSPYLLVGFEDLPGGGDLDYNDCVFLVDIGLENARYLDEEVRLKN